MKLYLLLVAASLFAIISGSKGSDSPDSVSSTGDDTDYLAVDPLYYVDEEGIPPLGSDEEYEDEPAYISRMIGEEQKKRMAPDERVVKKRDVEGMENMKRDYYDYYHNYYYDYDRKRMIKNADVDYGVERMIPDEKVVKKRDAEDDDYYEGCEDYDGDEGRAMPSDDLLIKKREVKNADSVRGWDQDRKRMIKNADVDHGVERMAPDEKARTNMKKMKRDNDVDYPDVEYEDDYRKRMIKNADVDQGVERMAPDEKVVKKRDAEDDDYYEGCEDYDGDEGRAMPSDDHLIKKREVKNADSGRGWDPNRKRMIKNADVDHGVERMAPDEKVVKKRDAEDDYLEGLPEYDGDEGRMIKPGKEDQIMERMALDQRARAKDAKKADKGKDTKKNTEDEDDYYYGYEDEDYAENEEDYENYKEDEYNYDDEDYERRK